MLLHCQDPKTHGCKNHYPRFNLRTPAVSSVKVMALTSKVLGSWSGNRYAHGFKSGQVAKRSVTCIRVGAQPTTQINQPLFLFREINRVTR